MNKLLLTLVLLLLLPGLYSSKLILKNSFACKSYHTASEKESMTPKMVIEHLKNGINTDFTFTDFPDKVLYEPGYFDAVKSAGFESVRIFAGYKTDDPGIYEQAIKDAIERDLVIVFLYFGNEEGKVSFMKAWEAIAEYYKDYPDNLVFEILNEPAFGSGLKDKDVVMEWYNSVIPVIRRTNPKRVLLIGGPMWNEPQWGSMYLTPEHLTYKLDDGTGFLEDKNIVGAFHHYVPTRLTMPQGKYVKLSDFPQWKTEITSRLDLIDDWGKKYKKPAIMTEWGAQTPTIDHSELIEYTRFFFEELKKRDIGSIYYTAQFSNKWVWSIFDSEWGWDQDMLDILTGVKAPAPPPTNPLLNPEFNSFENRWTVSDTSRVFIVKDGGLSGNNALRVSLAGDSAKAFIYQETDFNPYPFNPAPKTTFKVHNKFNLHLRKGNTYKLTFLARAEKPGAVIKARFEQAHGEGVKYWTSDPVVVETGIKEYVIEYNHNSDNVNDLRLTILFEGSNNTVYFDRVALRSTRNY